MHFRDDIDIYNFNFFNYDFQFPQPLMQRVKNYNG